MLCNIDLRFLVPPLIFLLLSFQPNLIPTRTDLLSILNPTFFLLIIIFTLLFLCISISFPLNVTVSANSIQIRVGDFSSRVAVLLPCAILFPFPYFWAAFLIILGISPWQDTVLNLLQSSLYWLFHTLQAIPALNVVCFLTQQQDHPQGDHQQDEIELVEIIVQD